MELSMLLGIRFKSLSSIFLLFALILTGCSGSDMIEDPLKDETLKMLPVAELPADIRAAPLTVQQAYQFAATNPDVLGQIPCYCGCGAMGHTSNYACYVAGQDQDGTIQFDNHALGCSICVDITLDAMRLLKEGKAVDDIRGYVDNTYSQFGPSNMP
jgi:hypothetical protein